MAQVLSRQAGLFFLDSQYGASLQRVQRTTVGISMESSGSNLATSVTNQTCATRPAEAAAADQLMLLPSLASAAVPTAAGWDAVGHEAELEEAQELSVSAL